MNNRCIYCDEEILQPVRKNQRFCNVTLGKNCHRKFKYKITKAQTDKDNLEKARIKYEMRNPEKARESNRKGQHKFYHLNKSLHYSIVKRSRQIKRLLKQDLMVICVNGKAL